MQLVIFSEKIVEVPLADGSTRMVVRHVKDFSPLYDLAYQFYHWYRSPAYIAPTYQNAVAIRQQPELALYLATSFNCYKRILCNQKPGRKPQPQPSSHDEIEKKLIAAIARDDANQVERKSFSKSFSKSFASYTEKRRTEDHFQDKYTNVVASSSEPEEMGAAGASAIGSTNQEQNQNCNDQETEKTEREHDHQPRNPETIEPFLALAAPVPCKTRKNR